MSQRNRNSASQQNESQGPLRNVAIGFGTSILPSLGTAFSICFVTATLLNYYVGERFGQGLDAGVGMIFVFLFGLPILFLIASVIWVAVCKQSRLPSIAFDKWLLSLLIGLGAGYLITALLSNNWNTESYRAYVSNQGLLFLGFPSLSVGIYGIALNMLNRSR